MQNSLDNLPNLSSIPPLNEVSDFAPPDHSLPTGFLRQRKSALGDKSKPRQRHDAAAQTAKREILTNVRDDWIWPVPPSHSLVPPRITPSTQWCERFSDSSSLSPSPPPSHSVLEPANPYKYDNPDSITQPVITRKRKRLQRLRKELVWNEGLATYTQRRDAWAGARTSQLKHQKPNPLPTESFSSPPNTTTAPSVPPMTRRSASKSPPPPLLPLSPPLISSSNPIRASITPATYPTIYSKVIVQGLTPTVPINLSDVVKSLVQGWKEKGEWPPKPEGELGLEGQEVQETKKENDVVGKPSRLRRKGVGRVKRVLGLGERQDGEGV